jgi:hypothetical protein
MDKEKILEELRNAPATVLSAAYLYAVNYCEYGEDITKEWTTAVQNAAALEKAYIRGRQDERESLLRMEVQHEDTKTVSF